MIGSIGWEEFDDRQTDDRQTDKLNPSVPYNTFACFAGLIIISKNFKLIHAKVKKVDLRMSSCTLVVEIQAMIYNVTRDRRLSTKFQVDTYKTKKDRPAHAQLHTV